MTVSTDTKTFVCAIPFAGPFGDCVYDEVVYADDPRYLSAPANFAPAGSPKSEWPGVFDEDIKRSEQRELAERKLKREQFEQAARQNPIHLEAPRQYRLKADLLATHRGQPALVKKGSTVIEGDPLLGESDQWVKA